MWKLFGLHREGDELKLAVRWVCNGSYSVVRLSLVEEGMRWRDYPSEKEVRRELGRFPRVGGQQ